MMTLNGGGKILVIGGYSKSWDSYRSDPRIEFWTGEQKDIRRYLDNKSIPDNCKGIIISRFISHTELGRVLNEARNKNILLQSNKSDGEISRILDEITRDNPPKKEEAKPSPEPFIRGKLTPLIEYIDFSKSNVEAARLLLIKAKELNISTNESSLSQLVSKERHKQNRTGVPKSIRSKLDISVDMLDAMIKDLEGMREFLIEVTEENRILKTKMKKLQEAFE